MTRQTFDLELDRLQARIDFACGLRRLLVDLQLRNVACMRPFPQRREHLSGLSVVCVDGLFAEHDQLRCRWATIPDDHGQGFTGICGLQEADIASFQGNRSDDLSPAAGFTVFDRRKNPAVSRV